MNLPSPASTGSARRLAPKIFALSGATSALRHLHRTQVQVGMQSKRCLELPPALAAVLGGDFRGFPAPSPALGALDI